jgi:hypothetical protein
VLARINYTAELLGQQSLVYILPHLVKVTGMVKSFHD